LKEIGNWRGVNRSRYLPPHNKKTSGSLAGTGRQSSFEPLLT
jgi:hypothetical protein